MRKSRDKNENKRLARRALAFGVLVLLGVVALLLPTLWQQYQRNAADLEAVTRVQAAEVAIRLQHEIDHHLKLLRLFRDTLVAQEESSSEVFRQHAEALVTAWPSFQAINWITPGGWVSVVAPEAGNRSALGMNIRDVPEAADAFERAMDSGELAVTAPLQLRQGGRGITTYLPVIEDQRVQGVLNGVFRLRPLFEAMLGGTLLERYAVEVSDDGTTVFSAGRIAERFRARPRVSVMLDGRRWQVLLAPRAESATDFAAQFRQQMLGTATLGALAGLLAGLLFYKQMSLRGSEQRFRELNRLLPDMVFECNADWQVTYMNRLAQQQLGYADVDIQQGLPLDRLLDFNKAEDSLHLLCDDGDREQPTARISTVHCRNGESVCCEITLGVVRDKSGGFQGLRGVMRDITDRLEAEHAMNRLANFDNVTQLPNRAMFQQVLAQELQQAGEQGRSLVLMVVDLDQFKHINDRLGPTLGDALLREAGQRLREALDRQDHVFRISGDEFAVLFDGLETRDEVDKMAERMLDAMRKPYRLRGHHEESVGATIGVSRYPADAGTVEQMYMHADAAVYEAKAEGGRRFRVFTHEISRQLKERKQVEEALRHAVRENQLRLYYQPVVDADVGEFVSLEALVRWQHPDRGLLTPYHFIRIAEETGLIDDIGAWVLQEACRQLVEWDRQGFHVPQVAVNVSAHQLESGVLGADVRRALGDHELAGERLVLELTESLLMRNVQYAAHTLHELKRQGVRTAMDDFGTGYSSLAYLNRLPLDTIKIDRAFIAPIAEPGGDTRVTRAVIALGRSLKLRTVAEGVENAQQAEFLLEHGCSLMQGYHFGRPAPAEEIARNAATRFAGNKKGRRASA